MSNIVQERKWGKETESERQAYRDLKRQESKEERDVFSSHYPEQLDLTTRFGGVVWELI